MWKDPIVEEVRAVRAQRLAAFHGDVHEYFEYVLHQQKKMSATTLLNDEVSDGLDEKNQNQTDAHS